MVRLPPFPNQPPHQKPSYLQSFPSLAQSTCFLFSTNQNLSFIYLSAFNQSKSISYLLSCLRMFEALMRSQTYDFCLTALKRIYVIRFLHSRGLAVTCTASLYFWGYVCFWGTFSHFWVTSGFLCIAKSMSYPQLAFFQLIFQHVYFHRGLFFGGLFRTFASVALVCVAKSTSYLQVAFFSTDF